MSNNEVGRIMLPVRAKRRNETRDLTKPIEAALNAIPGVWAARNDVKRVPVVFDEKKIMMRFGLGIGSADIVGTVLRIARDEHGFETGRYAQAFGLEVKPPDGTTHHGLSPEQVSWAEAQRRKGWVVETVNSIAEAVAVVDRIRSGA